MRRHLARESTPDVTCGPLPRLVSAPVILFQQETPEIGDDGGAEALRVQCGVVAVFRTNQTTLRASHASASAIRVVPMTGIAHAAGGGAVRPPRRGAGDVMGKEL